MSKLISGASAAVVGLIVFINLAWISLLAWGIVELVLWVTSK